MRKLLLLFVAGLVLVTQTVSADTIHLKNGSVLKGKVTSFADDQFIVMLDTGSGRYLSKAMVYIGDVSRIDFEGSPVAASESPGTQSADTSTSGSVDQPRETIRETPRDSKSKNLPIVDIPTRRAQPVDQPRETTQPESQPAATESTTTEKPTSLPEKPASLPDKTSSAPPASDTSDTERPIRKPYVALKTINVDVAARKDWTSSGLIVKRGDHLRVTASGTITLEPTSGRTSGPEGLSDLSDPKKLMPDQPTGALIGVISSDNDDFIFIGRSSEFTATRDGLLFLSVNEGVLSDNLGTFKAVVEVLGLRGR